MTHSRRGKARQARQIELRLPDRRKVAVERRVRHLLGRRWLPLRVAVLVDEGGADALEKVRRCRHAGAHHAKLARECRAQRRRRACLEVLAAGSCCFAGGAALAWAHETWIRTLFRRLLMLEVCKGDMAQSEWCFLSILGSRGAS